MIRKIAACLFLPTLAAAAACSITDRAPDERDQERAVESGSAAPAASTASPGGPGAPSSPSAGEAQDGRAADGNAARAQRDLRRAVLFLGTSLTAGYGLGAELAYPARLQELIDSAGLPFRVVNAGLSGETSAGGLRRLDWSLQDTLDVLVLELGANDGLRGLRVPELQANLDSILTRTQRSYPDAALVVLGMEAPPNLGSSYTSAFRQVFRDVARKHDAELVPFLLDGVAAQRELNVDDGLHPNAEGHRRIARTVWETLGPLLERRASGQE